MNRLLLIFMFVCLAPSSAHAQCAMPSGPPAEAGVIIFNDDHKVMQYCNGDKWIGLWGGKGGGGLPACANGDIAQFTAGEWRCGNGSTIDNLNASNLKSGTIPDARFPATLPAVSGANLTNLNASRLTSGTVPTARLGTGAANNTTFLRGDGTWAAPSGGGFGGAYSRSSGGGCKFANPITGSCSCPSGFNDQLLANGISGSEQYLNICWK